MSGPRFIEPNPLEVIRRKFGIGQPQQSTLGQLDEGVPATLGAAASQAQAPQGQSPLGQDGGGFLQKLLQVLMNPAVQQTAGAVGSAIAGPRELRAFTRQSALQSEQGLARSDREAAERKERRDIKAAEFDREQELEKAELARKKQRVDSGKALADLSFKGFDPVASAEILGIGDPSIIEAAGKLKPNIRYVDTSTGKLSKTPSDNSIGPFSAGEAFKLGMDVKKFNRGEKLTSPVGKFLEDIKLLDKRISELRDSGTPAVDLIGLFNEREILVEQMILQGSTELERFINSFPPEQRAEIKRRLVMSKIQGTQRVVFGPDGEPIFAEGPDVFQKIEERQAREQVTNAVALLRDTALLRENLTPFTVGPPASILGTVAGLVEPFEALMGSTDTQRYIEGVIADIEARGEDTGKDKIKLELFDPKRPRAQALITSIAYKLARLNDPSGGRLSDFDVEQALEILTGGQPITSPFGISNALDIVEQQAQDKIRTFAPRFGSSFEQETGSLQVRPPAPSPALGSDLNDLLSTIMNDPSVSQDIRERVLEMLEQRLTQ